MALPHETEVFFAKSSEPVRYLALYLRELILEVMPNPHEKYEPGWGNVWFGHGPKRTEQVFTISPLQARVNFYFLQGRSLPDPSGLFEGQGKAMADVKLRSIEDAARPEFRELVKAAAELGR